MLWLHQPRLMHELQQPPRPCLGQMLRARLALSQLVVRPRNAMVPRSLASIHALPLCLAACPAECSACNSASDCTQCNSNLVVASGKCCVQDCTGLKRSACVANGGDCGA